MSQRSLFSDLQSSLYDDDSQLDNTSFDFTNDLLVPQLQTPEPIGSQSFLPPSDFARPSLPPPIPDNLQRVGPNRIKQYVLQTIEDNTDFTAQQIYTYFRKQKKVKWDRKHSAEYQGKFDQVADIRNRKPYIICRNCNRVLNHPGASRGGTSSINKHIEGVNCRNASRRLNIKKAIEYAVRLLNLYSLLYSNLYTRRVVLLLSQYLSPRIDRSDRFLG